MDTKFSVRRNQEEVKDIGSALSKMVNVITYVNFPIIWAI